MSHQDEEENAKTQIVKPKLFNLSSKTFSSYQTKILLHGSKYTPTPNRNNIELAPNIQSYTRRLRLAEFFQNNESNDSEEKLFQKQSTSTPPHIEI